MQQSPLDSGLLNAFDQTQRRGFDLLREVVGSLSEGMSELDISDLAQDLAGRHGFDRWFHPPEIQIGANTMSNAVWKTPSGDTRLRKGDLVMIDLGPSDNDSYADVGTTLCFDRTEPDVVTVARECCKGTVGFCSRWKTVGELYVFARAWAINHRMNLRSDRSIGHAILPKEGLLNTGFPYSAHASTWLRRHQIRFLNPSRIRGMWAVRPLVTDGRLGASFREIVYVSEDEKRVLGRDSLDEVGTL